MRWQELAYKYSTLEHLEAQGAWILAISNCTQSIIIFIAPSNMRFSFACLLPVAVAAVIPRDAALVLNTLKIIEASFSRDNLIADAADYDGSLLNTLLFQQQVDIITVCIRVAAAGSQSLTHSSN